MRPNKHHFALFTLLKSIGPLLRGESNQCVYIHWHGLASIGVLHCYPLPKPSCHLSFAFITPESIREKNQAEHRKSLCFDDTHSAVCSTATAGR